MFPIERYIEEGRISKTGWGFLRDAIETRKNILIAGGTGSGKTTFVNAILDALAQLREDDRVLILEDTVELQCKMPNVFEMRTDTKSNTTMQKLVKASLRLRPDRMLRRLARGDEPDAVLFRQCCRCGIRWSFQCRSCPDSDLGACGEAGQRN